MSILLKVILLGLPGIAIFGQIVVTSQNTMILADHNFGLSNPLFDEGSPMSYFPNEVDSNGAAFIIEYTNQGGTGFDGYPSGTVGGFKTGGTYYPGNPLTSGMPVQIQNLSNQFRIKWKTFQENAWDADDKWWATINVIFDSGEATSEPVSDARDYDLVIQQERYVQDDLEDFMAGDSTRYWYFARTADGSIKPYTLFLDGSFYQWGVRYKFHNYPEGHSNAHKNDKVHIKFIPVDNSTTMPFLDHTLKGFIDCTVDYIQHVPLNAADLELAYEKVGEPTLWIKAISAGYEVYQDTSILGNIFFYTVLDSIPPDSPQNLTGTPAVSTINLNWDDTQDEAFESYRVYRSENGDPFTLLNDTLRVSEFTDTAIDSSSIVTYRVTTIDRSLNESLPAEVEINQPPQASDDNISLDEDTSIEINVLGNDSDPNSDPISILSIGDAQNGSVSFGEGDSNLAYAPDLNFFGVDSFNYSVVDPSGGQDSAKVLVQVQGVNDAPNQFSLVSPASGLVVDDPDSIFQTFTWEPAMDVDDEQVTYSLLFRSDSSRDTAFYDINASSYRFNIEAFTRGVSIEWSVLAMDDENATTASMDTNLIRINAIVGVETYSGLPETFTLEQNFPNPFNPMTTIRYGLPIDSDVGVVIYDLKGREIRSWSQTAQSAGWYEVVWDGTTRAGAPVATGIYLARFYTASYSHVIKMVYLR